MRVKRYVLSKVVLGGCGESLVGLVSGLYTIGSPLGHYWVTTGALLGHNRIAIESLLVQCWIATASLGHTFTRTLAWAGACSHVADSISCPGITSTSTTRC